MGNFFVLVLNLFVTFSGVSLVPYFHLLILLQIFAVSFYLLFSSRFVPAGSTVHARKL